MSRFPIELHPGAFLPADELTCKVLRRRWR
jgi:hypothetical protein